MNELERCLNNGQLKKTTSDLKKALASLAIAEKNQRDAIIQAEKKYLNELDNLREGRHKILYGDEETITLKEVDETEVDSAVKLAEGFLLSVKKLIGTS